MLSVFATTGESHTNELQARRSNCIDLVRGGSNGHEWFRRIKPAEMVPLRRRCGSWENPGQKGVYSLLGRLVQLLLF